jgi:hypothetical protein
MGWAASNARKLPYSNQTVGLMGRNSRLPANNLILVQQKSIHFIKQRSKLIPRQLVQASKTGLLAVEIGALWWRGVG